MIGAAQIRKGTWFECEQPLWGGALRNDTIKYKRLRERLGRHRQEHLRRRLCYFSQIDRLPPAFGLVFRRNAYLLLRLSHDWHGARH